MIKEMENNTIQITLEFYNVIIKVSEQRDLENFNLSVEESIEKYFTNLKKECQKYAENSSAINIEDSGTFIELLPTKENMIFGIIGKSSEIKEGVLKRIKNSNGKEIDMYPLYWTSSKEGIFMKYSYEFKKECVQLYREGKWPDTPEEANEKNFHDSIRIWVRL